MAVIFRAPATIDNDFNPLSVEERMDLPEIAFDHLPALNAAGADDEVALEMPVVAESSTPEVGNATYFQALAAFHRPG